FSYSKSGQRLVLRQFARLRPSVAESELRRDWSLDALLPRQLLQRVRQYAGAARENENPPPCFGSKSELQQQHSRDSVDIHRQARSFAARQMRGNRFAKGQKSSL